MTTGSKGRHCLGMQRYCQESQSSGKVEIAKGHQGQHEELLSAQMNKKNKKGASHHASK